MVLFVKEFTLPINFIMDNDKEMFLEI